MTLKKIAVRAGRRELFVDKRCGGTKTKFELYFEDSATLIGASEEVAPPKLIEHPPNRKQQAELLESILQIARTML